MAVLIWLGITGWLGLLSVVNLLAILHHRHDYQQDQHQKQRRLESLRAYRHRQQDLLKHWDPSCQFFSGSLHLPCALQPLGPCRCREYQPRPQQATSGDPESSGLT
ncbi:MAG: DUF6464 family protein [Cyanophyceae cyanobacterium]